MTDQINTGAELLVQSLQALGAEKCFGVPGESYLSVLDALHNTPGEFDFIGCRNEGGSAFMAAAYGKLTRTPGICFVTRGPGAANASIGIHTAMQDSVPMLLFIGQVNRHIKDREAFQEVDCRACFGPLAKWVTEITDADRIPEILSRAWSTALSGRPGPVVIALPEDMLTMPVTAEKIAGPAPLCEAAPHPEAIEQLRSMLRLAERPLIIAGGGGWSPGGQADLQNFAQAHDIPVLAAFRFQDLFDNHSRCYAGDLGIGMIESTKELVRSCDMILALNIRFGEMTTDSYSLLRPPLVRQRLAHVHASAREIAKVYIPTLGIHSGPNTFAAAMSSRDLGRRWEAWCKQARQVYEQTYHLPPQPGKVDMRAIMAHLRERLPDDAILTNGAGNFTAWPNKFFKFGPRQRLLAPQSGAMGFGLPAAIAAKIAEPERVVVCFAGDGDFQMNCQELGTAMQYQAQPIILILNNSLYGTIRMHQERQYPGRQSGTVLRNPDFCTLAQAYGFFTAQVTATDEFAEAFESALQSKQGAVLDLIIDPQALTPRQSLSQIRNAAEAL